MRAADEYGVRLNVRGREPAGVVPMTEYETVRRKLIAFLSELQTPDGSLAFETVAPREAFYRGPRTTAAADVIVVPEQRTDELSSELSGGVFGPTARGWKPTKDGVIVIRGDGIDTARRLVDASILDIAPTILAMFGISPPSQMDGDVLPVVGDREAPASIDPSRSSLTRSE
jgi:predicted AlkP superfamily phosphohydrolase/phosphomutase